MFNTNKILVVTLLATLALAIEGEQLPDIKKYVVERSPPEAAVLTQLKSKAVNSTVDTNAYKCTAGTKRTDRISCSNEDKTSWHTPHDVKLVLRCPPKGSGDPMSFVEIQFETTSPNVDCRVSDGGIGLNYIAITINTWNTLIFNYAAKFYAI